MPPVTAERSPPDSRITGADSPVTADSLTEAMPSTTSPSVGMVSPASTSTTSPTSRSSADLGSHRSSFGSSGWSSSLARVSLRVRRRASACALPRPSAIASAKFANSTVNHNQAAIWPVNSNPARPSAMSRMSTRVTSRATTPVTNITGLRTSFFGASLMNESSTACRSNDGSNNGGETLDDMVHCPLEGLAREHLEVLDDRTKGE